MNFLRTVSRSLVNLPRRLRSDETNNVVPLSTIAIHCQASQATANFNDYCEHTLTDYKKFENIIKCFDAKYIKEEFKQPEKLLLLKAQIDESCDKISVKEVEQLNSKCKNKSIILLIESKSDGSYAIYWKLHSIDKLLTFVPYQHLLISNKKILYEFLYDFLAHSMKSGKMGLESTKSLTDDCLNVELHHFADIRNFGLLMIAADWGRNEVIEELLNQELETEAYCSMTRKKVHAVDIAWNKDHNSDILLKFLHKNLPFPESFDISHCSDEIKEFLSTSNELHEAIKAKNEAEVVEILTQNQNQRHFYNSSNESAAKLALTLKFIDIYEVLVRHKVHLSKHEKFTELSTGFSRIESERIKEIHFNNSIQMPDKHLHSLTINSSIAHDDPTAAQRHHFIRYAFDRLNAIPLVRLILMVISASKIFNILFDFNRETINFLDPTEKSFSKGLFYTVGRIYIAAQELLRLSTERETFGTLAHELCHYAMKLVYDNDAKPYSKRDKATRVEFERISEICRQNRQKEHLISLVYDYPPNQQHAELIVRVPHLMALYHKQPERLRQIREDFIELFVFYETKVFRDMEKALPKIETKNRIEEKNFTIFKYKTFFIIFGILLSIGSIAGIFITRSIYYQETYSFDYLSVDDQVRVKNAFVNYKNVSVKLCDLYPNNSTVYSKLTTEHISQLLESKPLHFDDPHLYYLDRLVLFDWERMASHLKEKVYKSHANFQGQKIKIIDLTDTNHKALNSLTSEQLKSILNGTEIKVGQKVETEVTFYAERKFILEDAKLMVFEYFYGHDYIDDIFKRADHENNRIANKSFQEFSVDFFQQNVDTQLHILDKIKENIYYKRRYFNLNHESMIFLHKNSSEIIKQSERDQMFILSSEAGAGKTVTFEHLAIEIKQEHPGQWVSYIDLKDYTHLFQRNGAVENVRELLEKILNLSSKNEFERKIFEAAFKSGIAVLLWNGFDEISPTFNELVLNLIKNIHENTKNIQFVCTRPLYSDQLSKAFRIRPWQLITFDENDRRDFLRKFFISRSVSSEKIDETMRKVEGIISKLSFHSWVAFNFNTPLMLNMVAEIHDNENLLNSENLYGIYETFIDQKIDIWSKKVEGIQKPASKLWRHGNLLKKIFQKYAFLDNLNLFGTHSLAFKLHKLEIMQTKIPGDLSFEEISSMGILYINGKNEFEFAHRTFSEFFLAQYFIENIYEISGHMDKDETEVKLELFYCLTKQYQEIQKIVTDFMSSYLENSTSKNKKFNSEVSQLLMTKFKNLFFRMLDANYAEIYKFLFKFFQKDHDLLVNLLHVYEAETFYTAIFNPNYFALFINPEEIKCIARTYLTDDEFQAFLTGRHQRGKILLGMHFYRLINISKLNDIYPTEPMADNVTSYWTFLYEMFKGLTRNEQKELVVNTLNPKIHLFFCYHLFRTNFSDYQKFWTDYENLLSQNEIQDSLGDAFIQYMESYPGNVESRLYMNFLLETAEKYLTDSQIFEMFLTKNILHEAHWNAPSFHAFWYFLSNHTNAEERRKILLQDDLDDKNFYFSHVYDDKKNLYSGKDYMYYFYDFTPFKIIHRSMTILQCETFEFTVKIYQENFNKTEIQDIILSSQDFIIYTIGIAEEEPFRKFVLFFEELFEGNEKSIKDFLSRKVKTTDLSVFELVVDFRGIANSNPRWFNNLKILTEFHNKIKN